MRKSLFHHLLQGSGLNIRHHQVYELSLRDPQLNHPFPLFPVRLGTSFSGGGNWGTRRLGNPKDSVWEDWGTLGKIRGITNHPPLRILLGTVDPVDPTQISIFLNPWKLGFACWVLGNSSQTSSPQIVVKFPRKLTFHVPWKFQWLVQMYFPIKRLSFCRGRIR